MSGGVALASVLATSNPNVATAKEPVKQVVTKSNIVAKVIAGEAAGEGELGMTAVACVIQNRMKNGKTAEQIVKAPSQFSAMEEPAMMARNYRDVKEIADKLASQIGSLKDITGGETNYLTTELYNKKKNNPKSWASKMTVTKVIGKHTFLK
jgi:spore germination cell wall hydrolase CwlJ-like protein